MNLGGYDNYSLHLAPRAIELPQEGYVGCVRGFKIADHVVDLSRKAQEENPGKNDLFNDHMHIRYFRIMILLLYWTNQETKQT